MGVPRPAVNNATTSVGFTVKLVTVQSISVDGKTAVCTDRQHTQVSVPMMIQPSKAMLPAVGETWLVTQSLGQWTFAAIVATSPAQFQQMAGSEGVYVSTTSPPNPVTGELWINPALDNLMSYWNGTNWIALQMGALAIAPGSLTHVQLSEEANIAASQVNFTASDIGGLTTTISATEPADPSAGDLWYDAENGYQLKQWSGVNWIPYQWGTQAIAARAVTAELIAANTITAAQLAAGIVYAGIIDGTIVEGTYILGSIFQGTNWIENEFGSFLYSGTPAPGNLIASVTPAAGNDSAWTGLPGNPYAEGVAAYSTNAGVTTAVGINLTDASQGGLSIIDINNPPSSPPGVYGVGTSNVLTPQSLVRLSSGSIAGPDNPADVTASSQSTSGTPLGQVNANAGKVILGNNATVTVDDNAGTGTVLAADGQVFAVGHRLTQNSAGTLINSGGLYQTILSPGTFGVGTYWVRGQISYSTSVGSPTGSPRVIFDQGAATLGHVRGLFLAGNTAPVAIDGSVVSVTYAGQTLTSGSQLMTFDFVLPVTVAGTFLVQAASTGSSYNVNFANLRIEPV